MADKIVGSVRHKGVTYKPGDEAKFSAAIKASKIDGDELQRLADRGTITGFGAKAAEEDDSGDTKKSKSKGGKGKKDAE